MVLFGPHLFVGEHLTYDFKSQYGMLKEGKGALFPWYFGADTLFFFPGGKFAVSNAFFTTSENKTPEWKITTECATLSETFALEGRNVRIKIGETTLFWFPRFKTNLDFIFDNPMRTYFRAGGRRGSRFGMTYKLYTSAPFDLYFHLDYRLFRGPGGGFETKYLSKEKTIRFDTINYVAKDTSIENPIERLRYRFQGSYHNLLLEHKTTIQLTYDKLSDRYMATDYIDTTLKFIVPEKTELQIRRQDDFFITNLYTRVKVNPYQSIKQELPFIKTTSRPINLRNTPFIFEQTGSIGYLDYNYSDKLCKTEDFDSFRLSYTPTLFASFSKGITISNEFSGIFIYYQKTPLEEPQFLGTTLLNVEANFFLHKETLFGKHLIKPYASNDWILSPTSLPNEHYIFDINDGWFYLNTTRFGVKQWVIDRNLCMNRLEADLFAYAFVDAKTFEKTIPRIYGNIVYHMTPFLRHTFETAWDVLQNNLLHFNARLQWTINKGAALSLEYRYRSAYDFRKVDYFNFILESYRTEKALLDSTLSDKRDTCLVHLFFKFHPEWALEVISRYGSLRTSEPSYLEYEIGVIGELHSAWNVKASYQYLENDHRFVFGCSLGLKRPNPLCKQLKRF
jgi:hypothetical protein